MGNKIVGPDSKLLWWGYLHKDGTVQVKRYFSHLDVRDAKASSLVYKIARPFEADNREAAVAVLDNVFKYDIEHLNIRRKDQGADVVEHQG